MSAMVPGDVGGAFDALPGGLKPAGVRAAGSSVEGLVIRSTGSWYRVVVRNSIRDDVDGTHSEVLNSGASHSDSVANHSDSNASHSDSDTSNSVRTIVECRLPGRFRLEEKEVTNPIAVGDRVSVTITPDGTGTITEIHERENYIPRKATHGRRGEQILVANVDHAWVVQSVRQPKLREGFIDRFLVMCEAYQVPVGVLINKTDLAKTRDLHWSDDVLALYESLGYPFLRASAETGEGIETLRAEMEGRTSVFIGPSGAGKTSLLNAIQPDLSLRTGEVSSYSGKGKHTTTFAELIPILSDSYVVDTPGVREFGLVDIEPYELSLFFPEMIEPRKQCKFYNCTHIHEPGCGVMEAYEAGEIAASRYGSYLSMMDEIQQAN